MENWTDILHDSTTWRQSNINLTQALAHCWPLEAAGWSFRCVKCEAAYISPDMGATWHSHNEYQIQIAAGGTFEFQGANQRKFVIRPGEAVVIPWKSAHSWTCIEPGALMGISLEIQATVESIRSGGFLLESMQHVSSEPLKPLIDDLLKSSLEEGHSAFRSKITACRHYLLLSKIMEAYLPFTETTASANPQDQRGSEIVSRVIRYLNENFSQELPLEQIAHEIQLSGRQVHRLFLKHIGRSLHDYLLEIRLEKAFKLLSGRGNKMQIKEIAFSCGFNSLAYFSKCFRQAYGVSPSNVNVEEISLRPGFTVQSLNSPEEAPGPVETRKKRMTS